MAFSPDNRWVVTGSEDSTARLWDLKAADPAAQPVVLKGHEVRLAPWPSARTTAGWSPEVTDKTARLWDLKAADPAAQPVVLKGHEDPVSGRGLQPGQPLGGHRK